MSHSILSLHESHFDTRICFGGCLININGETVDCEVTCDKTNFTSPTYTVIEKETNKEICTFRPYHMYGGPFFYQIEGVSDSGGDAMLIVPEHGMLKDLYAESTFEDDLDDEIEDSPGAP